MHVHVFFVGIYTKNVYTCMCNLYVPCGKCLCAPTVIGPEVKTENRCRHLAAITHTSTFMQIIGYRQVPAAFPYDYVIERQKYLFLICVHISILPLI
jgi:carbon starvation protein CstA